MTIKVVVLTALHEWEQAMKKINRPAAVKECGQVILSGISCGESEGAHMFWKTKGKEKKYTGKQHVSSLDVPGDSKTA